MPKVITISASDDGQRLDRWLKRICPTVPFIGLQKAIRTGSVRVNGRKAKMDTRLQSGDAVQLPPSPSSSTEDKPAFIATQADRAMLLNAVVYEDQQILVFNKPQGLPSQAGGGQVKSLDRLLTAVYGQQKTPKLVHRLDRETSGLIVCAKNRTTAAALGELWAGRAVTKAYLALVMAPNLPSGGDFREAIAKAGPQAVIDKHGDTAHTRWVNLGQVGPNLFAVLAWPKTGRMNQIRVHFAHHGWPLAGDDKYGLHLNPKALGKQLKTGLALHAWKLALPHPATDKILMLEAPLPTALDALLTTQPSTLAAAHTAWQRWLSE